MNNTFKLGIKHFTENKYDYSLFANGTEDKRNYEHGYNKAFYRKLENVQARETRANKG
jgi:hypothetical protein